MALGILFIVFIVLIVLEIIGLLTLLITKKSIINKVAFVFLFILTLLVSFLVATSGPSNYIFEQIVGWSWGAIAIIAFVFEFVLPKYTTNFKYQKYAKYILALSSLAAMIDLIVL